MGKLLAKTQMLFKVGGAWRLPLLWRVRVHGSRAFSGG